MGNLWFHSTLHTSPNHSTLSIQTLASTYTHKMDSQCLQIIPRSLFTKARGQCKNSLSFQSLPSLDSDLLDTEDPENIFSQLEPQLIQLATQRSSLELAPDLTPYGKSTLTELLAMWVVNSGTLTMAHLLLQTTHQSSFIVEHMLDSNSKLQMASLLNYTLLLSSEADGNQCLKWSTSRAARQSLKHMKSVKLRLLLMLQVLFLQVECLQLSKPFQTREWLSVLISLQQQEHLSAVHPHYWPTTISRLERLYMLISTSMRVFMVA